MSFLTNTQLLTFKAEAVAGTYEPTVETTRPNVRFSNVTFGKSVEMDTDSTFLSGDWGNDDVASVGAKLGTVSADLKLTGGQYTVAGSVGTHVLTYKDLFSSVGLGLTEVGTGSADIVGGTYHFYPDSSKACKSMSFARFVKQACGASVNGYMESLRGCVGTFTINVGGRGQPFIMNVSQQGSVESVEDIAIASFPTFDDTTAMSIIPDKFLNTTITLTNLSVTPNTSVSVCVSTLSFDAGNTVAEIECQSTESGIKNYLITDIAPVLTIDPLLQSVAQFDAWGSLTKSDIYKVEIDSANISILVPRAQMTTADVADANGFMRTSIAFKPLRNIDAVKPIGLTATVTPESIYFISLRESLPQY